MQIICEKISVKEIMAVNGEMHADEEEVLEERHTTRAIEAHKALYHRCLKLSRHCLKP